MSELANKSNSRQVNGKIAEDLAVQFLLQQGYHLVARNYHCRYGEIDIIAENQLTLIFAEVRYRRPSPFANAAESINQRKQQRIILAAEHYLAANQSAAAKPCRFDCILLSDLHLSAIDWIQNAFSGNEY